jgi:PAS domain S-box-containing protein/putative nucleotidyltransferase with HDIG domain
MNPPRSPDAVSAPSLHWASALSRVLLPPLIFSLLCWLAAEINYLFFHALAEIFSIVVAFTAMMVATTSAKFAKNHFVVFVSVAIGWCAGIDLLHTLVFKGMHLLPGDSANPATQLWLVARYMQAVALLVSPLALRRSISPLPLHLMFGLVASLLVTWVFSGHFPVAYVDGQGLTPFKIYSELVIIAMLALFILRLNRVRADMTPRVFYSLLAAAACMILSEVAFTQYVSVYAEANLLGHVVKIFAYWFVYIALVRDTIREPFVMLQQEVLERQQLALERESLLHDLGERIKEVRCVNAAAELAERSGQSVDELLDGIVRVLPPGFVLPDKVRVCIQSDWGSYGSARPADRSRQELTQALMLDDRLVGTLVAWYPRELDDPRAVFLSEEQGMLRSVGRLVCDAIKRMQALERVQRLRYLFEMSSATSKSVVHSQNREALFDDLYDSLVAHGTFPLFFFAQISGDGWPLQLLRHYGVTAPFMPALQALLQDADSPLRGVVESVRSGQVSSESMERVFRDLSKGSVAELVQWRDFLQADGIIHRAALPLRCEGRLEGVVVIYARGLTAFDDEQLRLLQDISGEMGFALDNFARRTRLLEAQQQAHLLERRFQEVFQASPVPTQIVTLADHRISAINDAHQRMLGYTLGEISTTEAWFNQAFADPVERENLRQHWKQSTEQAIKGDPVDSPELTLRCKDGSLRTARGRMTVVGQDAIVAWTDLTEIRSSEMALQESERRFRSMVEQTLTAMFVRRNGRFIYVNPRFLNITGWQSSDLLGKSVLEFTSQDAENIATIRQNWADLHDGKHTSVTYTASMRCKNGQFIEIGLTAQIITWDDGAPATIVLVTDITEQKRAEQQIAAYVRQLEAAMRGTMQAVSNMVEMRDPYTAGHERRVGLIASAIAHELGWEAARCESLELLGLVHDIGKIAIPSEILTKPTRLTPLEREMMKGHVQAGYDILKNVPFPMPVAEIIRQHHERMDGSGYPQGLKGEEILPEARILAVADVLESMASHRPYRAAVGLEAALAEVVNNRGRLYAPEVVDAAVRLIQEKGYKLPT